MNEVHILNYLSAVGVYYTQLGKNSILVAECDRFPCKDFIVDPVNDTWTWGDKGLHGRGAWDFIDKVEQGAGGDVEKIKARLQEVMDDNLEDPEYGITIPQLGRPGAVLPKKVMEAANNGLFKVPPKSFNTSMMEKYLATERGIAPEVMKYFVDTKLLYESSEESFNADGTLHGYDHSLVFCRKNDIGDVIGAVKKSLDTGKYTDVPNSDKENSLYTFPDKIDSNTEELILFESEMDLLSYLSLVSATGRDWRFYVGVSMGGITPNMWVTPGLSHLLRRLPKLKHIRISFNNDDKGKMGAASLKLRIIEYYKSNGTLEADIPEITLLHPGVSTLSYHLNAEIVDWNKALLMYKDSKKPETDDYSKFDLKATFEANRKTKKVDLDTGPGDTKKSESEESEPHEK